MSLYLSTNEEDKSQNSFVIRTLPVLRQNCNEIYDIILYMYKQHGPQGSPPPQQQANRQAAARFLVIYHSSAV
jgi:hypothetical protein